MDMIEQRNETDIVWLSEPHDKVENIVVFSVQEPAIGPIVCAEAFIAKESEVIGTIMSKMMAEPIFVDAEDPRVGGWCIMQRGNTLFVRISSMQRIDPNTTNHWLFNYPVLRDMTLMLVEKFAPKKLFLLSSAFYSQHEANNIDDSKILPLFAWVPAFLAGDEINTTNLIIGETEESIAEAIETISQEIGLEPDEDWAKGSYSEWSTAVDEVRKMLTQRLAKTQDTERVMFG
jgi:CBS domain-containing protein